MARRHFEGYRSPVYHIVSDCTGRGCRVQKGDEGVTPPFQCRQISFAFIIKVTGLTPQSPFKPGSRSSLSISARSKPDVGKPEFRHRDSRSSKKTAPARGSVS
jgi:hypothetical protein